MRDDGSMGTQASRLYLEKPSLFAVMPPGDMMLVDMARGNKPPLTVFEAYQKFIRVN